MSVKYKILGVLCFVVAFILAYIEYLVIIGIGALGAWLASLVGATGGAHTGITLLAYIPVIGLMLLILLGVVAVIALGVVFIRGD